MGVDGVEKERGSPELYLRGLTGVDLGNSAWQTLLSQEIVLAWVYHHGQDEMT